VKALSTDERVLLFKNPAGGEQYAQALLTVFCAPTHTTVKLTTYSSLWIPEGIFENPRVLKDKLALLICADAEFKEGTWWSKNFYPIREVRIKQFKIEGNYLTLWVEALGYVKCKDYKEYSRELKKSLKERELPIPPAEKSYIAFDTRRDLEIICSDHPFATLTAWQNLAETLAGLEAFDKVAFYTLTEIEDASDKKKVLFEKTGKNEPDFAYKLVGNRRYTLTISHLLPFHNQEGKIGRLELELAMPKNLERDDDETIEICGRQGSQNVNIKLKAISSDGYSTIKIHPKDPFKHAPVLSIPVNLSPAPFYKRYWKRLVLIVPTVVAVFLYAYAQLIQGTRSYPAFQTLFAESPEAIGATISAMLLIIIPILISLIITRMKED
jgi:hypothetical protein